MRLLTAGEVCKVLSSKKDQFSYKTLDNWSRRGIVRPVVQANGTGNHRMFSVVDVLAIAMGRGLRANGYTLDAAGDVTEALMNMTEASLLKAFADGRTCIAIIDGHVTKKLVKQTAVLGKWGQSLFDVKRLYDSICAATDKLKQPVKNGKKSAHPSS